ncbi:hypothetical protein C7C45_04935 [Micromonospora arborensis]|uniref:Uncharacterized protein n=1 Tax=Micromonospora arborensis TaxID=2116518 RepID=A0A318P0E0_9ACTN|nr:hypothetical protein [Micromonospora arborensis]PYC75216.1 hypothetical protein C7C45_04935 [Micromonospora arborensis]
MLAETPQKRGARTLTERTTPEWRRERARNAHLAAAVNAVVERAPELTPDQVARLRAVFGTAAGSAGQRAA